MADTVEFEVELDIPYVLRQIENDDIVNCCGAGDLLDEIGMTEAVEHFKSNEVLDEIGMTEAMEHFGLVEPGEE